ncbi:hypothetical protein [Streptomyces sp. NPDC053541]|uniref:hypothetical protein n=1 Tax=Streptomyces sp. NPDC053541 TaxID=3365709 RepID=UPI0037CD1EA0
MSAIKVRKLTIGGSAVRCPNRPGTSTPRELTLIATNEGINATCGEMHLGESGKRRSRAQCFFPVENLSPAQLRTIAQAEAGKPFRLVLKNGGAIEGTLVAVGGPAQSTAARAAAAAAKTNGSAPAVGPAKPAGRATGGSMAAAFGAIAAVAGAAGQTAAAAGQIAAAGASAVESAASVGREGIGAARDGIREAGAYGERRHERLMRAAETSGGGEPEASGSDESEG